MNRDLITPLLIFLIIGGLIGWFVKPSPMPVITVKTETDTVFTERTITLEKIKPITKKEIIKQKVNIDSLWQEALNYFVVSYSDSSSYMYVNELDTTFVSDDLTLNVRFNSYIPTHPSSYFDIDARVRHRTIKETVTVYREKEPSFIDHFGVGVQAGYFYIPRTKQLDFGVGVGLSVNF